MAGAVLVGGALLASCASAGPPSSDVSGPGWNLVREGPHGRDAGPLVAFAGTAAALPGTWPFPNGRPPSDLGTSVVARFTQEIGGCDTVRLRRVVFNIPARLIYPIVDITPAKGSCGKPPVAYSHVVTLARKALPPAPFTVQSTVELTGDARQVMTVTPDLVGVAAPEVDNG